MTERAARSTSARKTPRERPARKAASKPEAQPAERLSGPPDGETSRVGLVIAGAGARGAYEMGALSVLVPWLRERGEAPRIVVGTSAGAINAVLVASILRAKDPLLAAEQACDLWRRAAARGVFRPLLTSLPKLGLRYLGQLTRIGDGTVSAVLDPAPLRKLLSGATQLAQVHDAVAEGSPEIVALIATATGRHRTEAFVETADPASLPAADSARRVTYKPAHLTSEHIMASAAIPVLFPSVRLSDPDGSAGDWYLDGGVRLNAPVKPALDLGADRLVVVATHPLVQPESPEPADLRPLDAFGSFATVITATLVDRMVEDVRALDRVNRLLLAGAQDEAYRPVPYLFAGPERNETIPAMAEAALHAYRGLEGMRNPDIAMLDRLIGGTGSTHGELLSYLLFEPEFIDALLEAGRSDAAQLIESTEEPWVLTGSPPVGRRD